MKITLHKHRQSEIVWSTAVALIRCITTLVICRISSLDVLSTKDHQHSTKTNPMKGPKLHLKGPWRGKTSGTMTGAPLNRLLITKELKLHFLWTSTSKMKALQQKNRHRSNRDQKVLPTPCSPLHSVQEHKALHRNILTLLSVKVSWLFSY